VAPGFDDAALKLLTEKPKWGKSVRLLDVGDFGANGRDARDVEVKKLVGGFLVQDRDLFAAGEGHCKVATKRAPTESELASLLFANRICKHVKSNAILLARGTKLLGTGAGQMSRVDSVHLAVRKAGGSAKDAVLASDAFFPFPDGVEAALAAGVTAFLQPGGSVRDAEVIAACDAKGAAMVFTGARHFRH